MNEDRVKTGEDLKKIADSKGVMLPAALEQGAQDVDISWRARKRASYDRTYMKQREKDHEIDSKLQESAEGREGSAAEAWVDQNFTVIRFF